MKKILLLRFSAMGDVLMLVPVVRSLTAACPHVEVTVATRPRFASFFQDIERVRVFEADVDYHFTGFFGLRKLFFTMLVKDDYDLVIDLHDHIRTVILRSMFALFGKKVVVFKKGRAEKRSLIRKTNKKVQPLQHTTERYRAALEEAGFKFNLLPGPWLLPTETAKQRLQAWLEKQQLYKQQPWIGVAPFALHKTKIWPLANYPSLIKQLHQTTQAKFFLFGGGEDEINYFNDLKTLFPEQVVVVAGRLHLPQEIALVKMLDVMICTDSANMHLAALAGTPVVSVWGGTHPDAGFAPLGQEADGVVQISRKELPCRPCSVYGKETCHRGDYACLTRITTETVAERVIQRLKKETS
ncbi:MAG: heptosyltransferase [Cyclobacteriaceae bacterium]|nr:MAG: heptosyltransferase [Cyclobacteriaceae bacterium]